MKIVVVGMGYVGIPVAALFADVDEFNVTGVQRRSKRSGWKIDHMNAGKNPIEGDEPGLVRLAGPDRAGGGRACTAGAAAAVAAVGGRVGVPSAPPDAGEAASLTTLSED